MRILVSTTALRAVNSSGNDASSGRSGGVVSPLVRLQLGDDKKFARLRSNLSTNQAKREDYTSAIHSLGILIWSTLKRCFPATLGAALTVNVLAANEGRGLLKGRDFEEETNEDGPVDS